MSRKARKDSHVLFLHVVGILVNRNKDPTQIVVKIEYKLH